MKHVFLLILLLLVHTEALAATLPPPHTDLTRIIRIRADAVVQIPWAALVASGWPASGLNQATVQVWRQGQQHAIQADASGLTFIAEASQSRYTSEAAYWITHGTQPGLRTQIVQPVTQPFQWEKDEVYLSQVPSLRGDHWFAGELRQATPTLTIALDLPALLPSSSEIRIAVSPGLVRRGHAVSLWYADLLVGTASWDDQGQLPQTLVLTTGISLPAGHRTLRLELASHGSDSILVDTLTIPAARLALPLLTPPIEQPRAAPAPAIADQIIIAHPALIPALPALVEAKQRHGRSSSIADVLALYDQYSWGERDPEALRAYLAESTGMVPRQSLLLVGAATTRLRYGPGEADPTMIPPFLINADGVYGEVACDSCFTRFDPMIVVPAWPVGRFPAHTLAEAQAMVAKTVTALDDTRQSGGWQRRMLLVADNDQEAWGTPDPAGPFRPLLETFTTQLPGLRATRFVYAPEQPGNSGLYNNAARLRDDLFSAWDNGAALIGYVGHANAWQWAWTGPHEPVAHLVAYSDAVRRNTGRLPILVSMTCLSGSFQNPTLSAIDEQFVRQANGGVVASLSPTGSGVNTGHTQLLAGLLPALRNGQSLGQAHLAGLRMLTTQPGDWQLAYSYTILGDPDVSLPQPVGGEIWLPWVIGSDQAQSNFTVPLLS